MHSLTKNGVFAIKQLPLSHKGLARHPRCWLVAPRLPSSEQRLHVRDGRFLDPLLSSFMKGPFVKLAGDFRFLLCYRNEFVQVGTFFFKRSRISISSKLYAAEVNKVDENYAY